MSHKVEKSSLNKLYIWNRPEVNIGTNRARKRNESISI